MLAHQQLQQRQLQSRDVLHLVQIQYACGPEHQQRGLPVGLHVIGIAPMAPVSHPCTMLTMLT